MTSLLPNPTVGFHLIHVSGWTLLISSSPLIYFLHRFWDSSFFVLLQSCLLVPPHLSDHKYWHAFDSLAAFTFLTRLMALNLTYLPMTSKFMSSPPPRSVSLPGYLTDIPNLTHWNKLIFPAENCSSHSLSHQKISVLVIAQAKTFKSSSTALFL